MIVPVWISSPSTGNTEILVYALLDTQSSHTFADREVCEKNGTCHVETLHNDGQRLHCDKSEGYWTKS